MNAGQHFVLGYGSLAAEHGDCHVAALRGYRRVWGVAMDNRVDLPGYKSYRLRSDGSRPAVSVAFLDVEPDPDASVTGICVPVDERALADLDRRERNYRRVDVTAAVAGAGGRVWAYRGSPDGRARLREAAAHGRAAVSRDYLDGVLTAIAPLAPHEAAVIERAIVESGLAVLDLDRVEIP